MSDRMLRPRLRPNVSIARVCLASLAAVSYCGGAITAEKPTDFTAVVAPLLQNHCMQCHGPRLSEAKLNLSKLSGQTAADGAEVWRAVLKQLEAGAMPPVDAPQPSADERAAAIEWILRQLSERATDGGMHVHPAEGNRIDHERLFSSKTAGPAASPPRIWRVRPDIFAARAGELVNEKYYSFEPWGTIAAAGFKDYASLYRIDEPETDLLLNAAPDIARGMWNKSGSAGGESAPFDRYLEADEPDEQQTGRVIVASFRQILGREPTDEEQQRFGKLLADSVDEFGRQKGLRLMMSAVLLQPEFVFRFELGGGPIDEHGRRMLTPQELAFAIGYSLRDEGPDEELLKAAHEGRLNTRDAVRSEVRRILDERQTWDPAIWTVHDPRTRTSQILRFFHQYFDYASAPTVFKDDETREAAGITHYDRNPDNLVEEADALVLHIVQQDKDVLKKLLTTRKSFAGRGTWKRWRWIENQDDRKHEPKSSLQHYNLDKDEWSPRMPIDLPAEQRAGILTHPAWLIAHSTNFENHAILRGKWIRERLLGGALPEVPITVDAKLPDEPHASLRERMRVTRESFCWQCHEKMDPLGLPFEMYDHFGRFRKTEKDRPVDTSGAIVDSGDPKLDGPVKNSLELVHKLAESERVEQVFVRHAFRYWMGRNETPADAGVLQDAHRAYRENAGSFQAVLIELLSSDAFLYRWVPETEANVQRRERRLPRIER